MNIMIITSFICILVPPILLMVSSMVMMKSSNREKSSPFECGFDPMNSARIPFSTRFFMLAVIFIVFDIEIVLLMPIPILITTSNSFYIMATSITFMIILIMGLLHEWMEGSLNWTN